LLAGGEVPAPAVARPAATRGADSAAGPQKQIRCAQPLARPAICAPAVPVTRKERAGRAGRKEGPPARTREVTRGCGFAPTATDPEGRPSRDPASPSAGAASETAAAFGLRRYPAAWRRGGSQARQKVVRGDGAFGIGNGAEQHVPRAVQIVDRSHARPHSGERAAQRFAPDERARKQGASLGP
jgi:hypothetical protein